MIGAWIGIILIGITAICVIAGCIYWAVNESKWGWLWAAVTLVVAALLIFWIAFSLYGTESGKRTQKSWESETQGGIYRIIRVYDIDGDLIVEYVGRFDTQHDGTRIIFDDEDGNRHIIYFSTGTVIIDEITEEQYLENRERKDANNV